jgi:hypothetical protein
MPPLVLTLGTLLFPEGANRSSVGLVYLLLEDDTPITGWFQTDGFSLTLVFRHGLGTRGISQGSDTSGPLQPDCCYAASDYAKSVGGTL